MAIHQSEIPPHWNYFLALEEDLMQLSRWVEFDRANWSCFSIELARLLMTAAQEADVVAKALCADWEPKAKAEKIGPYKKILLKAYPGLPKAKVEIPRYGLTLRPWADWAATGDNPPLWWTANNKVKHHRAAQFAQANLKNALNAASGLFLLLIMYYARSLPSISPVPRLFAPRSYAFLDRDLLRFAAKWA
jgi:hypothetical protein